MRFIAGLALGLLLGYGLVLAGWVALTNFAHVGDFEGAGSMQVAFFFAPVGALMLGLVLGFWSHRRKR